MRYFTTALVLGSTFYQPVFSQTGTITPSRLAGRYIWNGFFECGASIQLCNDSTFVYNWQQGLCGGQTKGKWLTDNKYIILNSEIQPTDRKKANNVEVMNQCTSPNTVIKVRAESGRPMPFANITVIAGHRSYSAVSDSGGIATFQVRSVRNITISYIGFKTITFKSKESSDNYFAFTMQEIDEPYHYFTNERWAVKGNRLYDYSIKTDNIVKRNYYEKVEFDTISKTGEINTNDGIGRIADTTTVYTTTTTALKSTEIPSSVFMLINLRYLSIQGMECDYGDTTNCWMIHEIPKAVANLTHLESLRLPLNAIQKVPNEICVLQHLKVLDLTDNPSLSNIDNVVLLTNLEKLYLFGCGLQRLPVDIDKLEKLKYLGLTGNFIDSAELSRIKQALPTCTVIFEK